MEQPNVVASQDVDSKRALVEVVPLERLFTSASLDGTVGSNRGQGLQQIQARNDREAVLAWLASHATVPTTLDSYRREAERLLLWALVERRKALSDLTHEDFLVYEQFLRSPQPADRWVMRGGKFPRTSDRWRPFAGNLSAASARQSMTIANGLFSWLVSAGYLHGNPLSLQRRSRAAQPKRIDRFLPQEHWQEVKRTILLMPTATAREAAHAVRARWLFSLLYIGGMRITEICTTSMSAFFCRRSGQDERWWLDVLGKGNKIRMVPATSELMAELITYRRHFGLNPLPRHDDVQPLVMALVGEKSSLTRSAMHVIVKSVVKATADRLRLLGHDMADMASHIELASAHWMRHTAGTHLSEKTDLKVVRDNLGHANLSTTSIYLHTEDDRRHDETEKVHRVDW